MIQGGAWTMNKEYRKRLFALMDEIDDLAKMGIHLEKEEVTGGNAAGARKSTA